MLRRVRRNANDEGFTLIELLVAIVVGGGLTAIAVVAIGGIQGTSSTAACDATMSAAVAASNAYFAHARTYPQTFPQLTSPPTGKPWLDRHGMTQTATTLSGRSGWSLQLIPGATPANRTTFSGC